MQYCNLANNMNDILSDIVAIIFLIYAVIVIAGMDNKKLFSKKEWEKLLTWPEYNTEKKQLEYIVNERKIPCAFERYYYIKLNMPLPVLMIEPETIKRHYQHLIQDDSLDTKNLNDIEAANKFFNDRLAYLSYLN